MPYTTPFHPLSTSLQHQHNLSAASAPLHRELDTVASDGSSTPAELARRLATTTTTTTADDTILFTGPARDTSVLAEPADRAEPDPRRLSRRLPLLLRKSSRPEVAGVVPSHTPNTTTAPAAAAALAAINPRSSSSANSIGTSSTSELRDRDNSAHSGLPSVEVHPPTQRHPDPARLSYNPLTPPATAGTPHRTLSEARSKSVVDRRGKLARFPSKLDHKTHRGEASSAADRKMHQTSSRLLRMTDDERPFTRVSRRFCNAGSNWPFPGWIQGPARTGLELYGFPWKLWSRNEGAW
ncbi:hypothetical protein AOQ84DRAFT_356822 [Glonium stellatum]|uniref:Uncharacterized protein n=1 Tax=Glonium stellatum TaxID=574774 RepID=A0A8E2ERP8_9PEZI|nr:hypothetical protein AOQ84DRAFT_356822 [Glonium stellatum]